MTGVLTWLGVAVLGGLGAVARYAVDQAVTAAAPAGFPWGTAVVNVSGSFLLGLLAGATLTGDARLLAATAAIGSYTTFSTWMLETARLRPWLAAANVGGSLVAGVAAVALGRALTGG